MKKAFCLTLIILLACVAAYAQKISPPLVAYPINDTTPLYRDAASFMELLNSVKSGLSGIDIVARIAYDVKRGKCKVISKETKCIITAKYQGACIVYVDPDVISYDENNGLPWFGFMDAFRSGEKIYTNPDVSLSPDREDLTSYNKISGLISQWNESAKKFKEEVVSLSAKNPFGLTIECKKIISKHALDLRSKTLNIINVIKESQLASGSDSEKRLKVMVSDMLAQAKEIDKLVRSVKPII